LALAIAAVGVGGGVVLAGHADSPRLTRAAPAAAGASRVPGSGAGTPAPTASPPSPTASGTRIVAADRPLVATAVSAVGQHENPVALLTSPVPLPARLIAAVNSISGATVITLDAGILTVDGHKFSAFAGDLTQLRAVSPGPTAASDGLWASLARGDLVVSYEGKAAKSGTLGGPVVAQSGTLTVRLRLGARAGFGISDADLVLSPARANQVGLVPNSALLIAVPPGGNPSGVFRQAQVLADQAKITAVPLGLAAAGTRVVGGGTWISLFQQAATTCPGLPWQVLAAIGQVESGDGRNNGPSSAGAVGPMQFLPSTFALIGVDANHDGSASPLDPYDAVYSAAKLLCADGAGSKGGVYAAVFSYNHADWYVREVLALAAEY
jgi:hypothetical protein